MIKIIEPISVIVSAYNEAKNIGRVLDVLKKIDWIDEIIVVDDGSADKTEKVVHKYPVELIRHKTNQGKGGAMATGIKAAKHELLLFLDADLVGLKEEHLLQILAPIVFTKEADLSLGVFGLDEIKTTNIMNKAFPSISGQRAIRKRYLPPVDEIATQRFGVDLFITNNVPKERRSITTLHNLTQVMKEEKYKNMMEGIKKRIQMYQEILKTMNEINKD